VREEECDEAMGAELRALVFQWLALCFSYPSEETRRAQSALVERVGDLWLFSQGRPGEATGEAGEMPPDSPGGDNNSSGDKEGHRPFEGAQILRSADRQAQDNGDLRERQMAYLRTFKRVTPYESEYTAAHALLPTDNIADVAGFYRAFGFQVKEGGERADHLAAELQFMALVALKEAAAREAGEEEKAEICVDAQKKFLAEHLGPFLFAVEERLAEYTKGDATAEEWLSAARTARALAEELAAKWEIAIVPPGAVPGPIIGALSRGVEAETLECPFAPPEPEDSEN
jgi:TorA maturation chaperone TorD